MRRDLGAFAVTWAFLFSLSSISARAIAGEPLHTRIIELPWPAELPCTDTSRVKISATRPDLLRAVFVGGSTRARGRLELSAASKNALEIANVQLRLQCEEPDQFVSWRCRPRGCSVFVSYEASAQPAMGADVDWPNHHGPEGIRALVSGRRADKDTDLIRVAQGFVRASAELLERACPEGRCSAAVTSCRAPIAKLANAEPHEWSVSTIRKAKVKLEGEGDGGEAVFGVRAERAASVVLACRPVEEDDSPNRCLVRVEHGACRWSHAIDPGRQRQKVEVADGKITDSETLVVGGSALKMSTTHGHTPQR